MNQKTKKFNIIDICIVLIIIVFAVGIGIRLSNGKAIKNETEITYTVEVKNVREFTKNALQKSNVLTDDKTGAVLGEIISVDVKPYMEEVEADNGELVLTEVPERYQCTVVLKSAAKEQEGKFMLDEKTEVAPGKTFDVITKYVKTTGTVVSVNVTDAESK